MNNLVMAPGTRENDGVFPGKKQEDNYDLVSFESVHYKKGQVIFHEDRTPLALYYIVSGKVKMHKLGSDGKEQIVRIAGKGSYMGYRAILTGTRYSLSATVLEDTEIAYISRDRFLAILASDTKEAQAFMQMLCKDLTQAEEKMVSIAYKPVRGRLAEALLSLQELYNEDQDKAIALSREDLASIVGTVKETVIRLLSEFRDDGIVATKGRKITIKAPGELTRISKMYD